MNPPEGYRMATEADLECLPAGALCSVDGSVADLWSESACSGTRGNPHFDYAVPVTPAVTGIEAQVCADIAARQQRGIQKYGTTVQDNPLPLKAWLQHAYEEALDHAIYLKRAIAEL